MDPLLNNAVKAIEILAAVNGMRLDSAETLVLARALVEIKAEVLRTEYGLLKATALIPLNETTPAGAEEISYRLMSEFGQATVIGNYADDVPVISTALDEFKSPIFTLAAAWIWTVLDLERVQKGNSTLLADGPRAVRNAIDRKIDEIAAIGIPEANHAGFVNHPNVTQVTLSFGDWLNPATTPAQIIEDLLELEDAIVSGTLENHYPDTLVLPGAYFRKLGAKRSDGSDETIWQAFISESQRNRSEQPGEWAVDRWSYLDSVSGLPRAVMYRRDPEVLELEVPLF